MKKYILALIVLVSITSIVHGGNYMESLSKGQADRTYCKLNSACSLLSLTLNGTTITSWGEVNGSSGSASANINHTTINITEAHVQNNITIGSPNNGEDICIFFNDDNMQDESICFNNAGDNFYFTDDAYVTGTHTAQSLIGTTKVTSYSDMYTTGTGDDLWLGATSITKSLWVAYANGNQVMNGTLIVNNNATFINITATGTICDSNGCIGSGSGSDGTGGWVNDSTWTNTTLKVSIGNKISIANNNDNNPIVPDIETWLPKCEYQFFSPRVIQDYFMEQKLLPTDYVSSLEMYDSSGCTDEARFDCWDSDPGMNNGYTQAQLILPSGLSTAGLLTKTLNGFVASAGTWQISKEGYNNFIVTINYSGAGKTPCMQNLTYFMLNGSNIKMDEWLIYRDNVQNNLRIVNTNTNNTLLLINETITKIPNLNVLNSLTIPILTITEKLNVFKIASGTYLNFTLNDKNFLRVTNNRSIMIGEDAYIDTSVKDAFAFGVNSTAFNDTCMALGKDASCEADRCIAIGYNVTCNETDTVKWGQTSITFYPEKGNIQASGNITSSDSIHATAFYDDGVLLAPGVPYTGATSNVDLGSYNLTTTGSATFGYVDKLEISEPDTPPVNTLRLFVTKQDGFSRYNYKDENGVVRTLNDDEIIVNNTRGSTIAAHRLVYVTSHSGGIPEVDLAKADSITTMPAICVTIESIANNALGRCMMTGLLENVNTNSYDIGTIYVSDTTAGIPTNTPPITPNLTQEVGTILVKSTTLGEIQIISRALTGDEFGTINNFTIQQHLTVIGNVTSQESIRASAFYANNVLLQDTTIGNCSVDQSCPNVAYVSDGYLQNGTDQDVNLHDLDLIGNISVTGNYLSDPDSLKSTLFNNKASIYTARYTSDATKEAALGFGLVSGATANIMYGIFGQTYLLNNVDIYSVESLVGVLSGDASNEGDITQFGSGVSSYVELVDGGTANEVYNYYAYQNVGGFGSTIDITDYYFFKAVENRAPTNIQNYYGIYLPDIDDGSVSNYAIYSAGGDSYFADDIKSDGVFNATAFYDDGILLTPDTTIGNCSGTNCDIGWGNLTSVPAGFADGIDDTGSGTDTKWLIDNTYLNNVSGTLTFNQTTNNNTIGQVINISDISPRSIWGNTASEAVRIGSTTDSTYATDEDDLYIKDELEVDGRVYFNNWLTTTTTYLDGTTRVNDDRMFQIGSSSDVILKWEDDDTNDNLRISLKTGDTETSGNIIIQTPSTYTVDFAHPINIDPTIYLHSNDTSALNYLMLQHNKSNAIIKSGNGSIILDSNVSVTGTNNQIPIGWGNITDPPKLGNTTAEIQSVFTGSNNISIDNGVISVNMSISGGLSGWERVSSASASTNSPKTQDVDCTGGNKLLGGGCQLSGDGVADEDLFVQMSYPLDDDTWRCVNEEGDGVTATYVLTAWAICATI